MLFRSRCENIAAPSRGGFENRESQLTLRLLSLPYLLASLPPVPLPFFPPAHLPFLSLTSSRRRALLPSHPSSYKSMLQGADAPKDTSSRAAGRHFFCPPNRHCNKTRARPAGNTKSPPLGHWLIRRALRPPWNRKSPESHDHTGEAGSSARNLNKRVLGATADAAQGTD